MSYDGHSGGYGVAGERVFYGVEVCVLKCREELTLEGSVNVTTFFVLSTLFGVLTVDRLLVEGSCQRRYVGCTTGVGWADEWVSGEKDVLSCRQDDPKVDVLAPAAGTLDRHCVRS